MNNQYRHSNHGTNTMTTIAATTIRLFNYISHHDPTTLAQQVTQRTQKKAKTKAPTDSMTYQRYYHATRATAPLSATAVNLMMIPTATV